MFFAVGESVKAGIESAGGSAVIYQSVFMSQNDEEKLTNG
jgi:hypothetical protein